MKKSTRSAGHTERETKVVRYAIEYAKINDVQLGEIVESFFKKEIEAMEKIPRKELIKEVMIEIQNTDREEMSIWSEITGKNFIDHPQAFCDFLQKKIEDGLFFDVFDDTDSRVIVDAITERVKQCYKGAVLEGDNRENTVHKPNDYVYPNDLVSNQMFNNKLKRGKPNMVRTVPQKNAGSLVYYDFLEEAIKDKNVSLTTTEFTPIVKQVHHAVVTLWAAGYRVVSNTDILRAMPGNPEAKMTLKYAKDIHYAMTFLNQQHMLISTSMDDAWLNIDDEKKIQPEKNLKNSKVAPAYRGRFIDFREIGFLLGKDEKIMITVKWELLACPILYQYAEAKNQIGRIPFTEISTHNICDNSVPSIPSTEKNKAIVSYLISRIEAMKHNDKMKKVILYSKIYEYTVTQKGNRTQKKRARDKVKDMIERFKINGYITDYEEIPMEGAAHGEKKGISIKI